MKVIIFYQNEKNISIEVEREDSIKALKYKIFTKTGIAACCQSLMFVGKDLANNDASLESYGIHQDCIIKLLQQKAPLIDINLTSLVKDNSLVIHVAQDCFLGNFKIEIQNQFQCAPDNQKLYTIQTNEKISLDQDNYQLWEYNICNGATIYVYYNFLATLTFTHLSKDAIYKAKEIHSGFSVKQVKDKLRMDNSITVTNMYLLRNDTLEKLFDDHQLSYYYITPFDNLSFDLLSDDPPPIQQVPQYEKRQNRQSTRKPNEQQQQLRNPVPQQHNYPQQQYIYQQNQDQQHQHNYQPQKQKQQPFQNNNVQPFHQQPYNNNNNYYYQKQPAQYDPRSVQPNYTNYQQPQQEPAYNYNTNRNSNIFSPEKATFRKSANNLKDFFGLPQDNYNSPYNDFMYNAIPTTNNTNAPPQQFQHQSNNEIDDVILTEIVTNVGQEWTKLGTILLKDFQKVREIASQNQNIPDRDYISFMDIIREWKIRSSNPYNKLSPYNRESLKHALKSINRGDLIQKLF